jgi:hypothetical protein
MRLFMLVVVGAAMVVAQGSSVGAPRPPAKGAGANIAPKAGLPVGKWNVEFANGVKEVCNIGNGGESTVDEPRRRSNGMAEVKGGSVVITFNDNRLERWTPVGKRYVVEHWFPASQVPVTTPVLGIAERGQ